MHELSIAESLIDQVISTALENNIERVEEVVLEVGILKQVVPDMMQPAFSSVCEGTIAEGAVLKIIEIGAEAKCNICHKMFKPEIDSFLCDNCNQADYIILKGDDIVLKSITCFEKNTERG